VRSSRKNKEGADLQHLLYFFLLAAGAAICDACEKRKECATGEYAVQYALCREDQAARGRLFLCPVPGRFG
jgi:hypothetical protein